MICPVDGPTERRQRRKTEANIIHEEGEDPELKNRKSSPMSSGWAKDDTRDKKKDRDRQPREQGPTCQGIGQHNEQNKTKDQGL